MHLTKKEYFARYKLNGYDSLAQYFLHFQNCTLDSRSRRISSNAHGHDDVAVAVAFVGERAHLPRGLFVFELDADRAVGCGGEKIQHVGRVETDGDGIAFIFLIDIFLSFAVLRAGCGDLDAFLGDGKLHRVRTLIGKLRDAPHGVGKFAALYYNRLVVLARKDRFVIRELAGEDARDQQTVADLKEEIAFVFGEIDLRIGARGRGQLLHFVHRLLGDQYFHLAIESGELLICFGKSQAVTVRGNHRQRVRL